MAPRRRLILTRAIGESLELGEDITVTVFQIRGGNRVRIMIEAPDSVHVLRTELKNEGSKEAHGTELG